MKINIKNYYEDCNIEMSTKDQEENFDYNELIELYDVREKMEKDMKELWKNVITRYIELCDERQILGKISPKYDYDKFYGFMVEHNDMYKYVLGRIIELEKGEE